MKQKFKVVVLDYTSANKTQIKWAINDALAAEIELILLVNSGLKNEQFGADNNPYGTIRIIAKEKLTRDKLYDQAKQVVGSYPFPSTAHKIRKGYKQAGMILTNQIIAKSRPRNGYIELLSNDPNISFDDLNDIERYKKTIFKKIKSFHKIPDFEKDLIDLIVITLQGYVEDWIEEQSKDAERSYRIDHEYWEESGLDCEAPPRIDHQAIRESYGNLDDVDNLLRQTDDDELSQIAYDSFYSLGIDEDIIEAFDQECKQLNLSPQLTRSIFSYCDFQFELQASNSLSEGFLLQHLVHNLTVTFDAIEKAHKY